MNCFYPWWNEKEKIFCPCGKCYACRQAKASEWKTRLLVELPYWKKVSFITLTYSNEFLPMDFSLHPEHLRDFWKRLRKRIPGQKIKYFACGEYGGKFGRPHYHAILFGVGTSKADMDLITDTWKMGRTSNDYVNASSIGYVTGYVLKKYGKWRNKEEYEDKGLQVPFQRTSRGLGLDYALAHGEDLSRQLSVRLFTGREVPIPRYFVKKLGIDTELLKNKASDSMVQMINGLFKRYKINREPTVANLGYMLFHSMQFDKFDLLNKALLDICEQRKNEFESKLKIYKKNS